MELELFNRVFKNLRERQERILSGKINCIPFGLPRFENELPGVERGKYYLLTANSKIGKTQICDFLFLYQTLRYAFENKGQIKLKIVYFSLEMSIEEKYNQFICHLLYVLSHGKIRIAPKDLRSTAQDKPVSDEILAIMQSPQYLEYFEFFEQTVTIIESIRNPYGIYKTMRDYALANGTQHKKQIKIINNVTKEESFQEVDDYYEPDNPEEYVICLVDHASLNDRRLNQ